MNNYEPIETLNNQKGITIIELLVSIVVGSVVTIMLIQILMLSVAARNQLAQDTALSNESYYIADAIERRIFDLEPQQIELITDDATQTVIEIRHLYDVTTDVDGVITRDYSNPVTDTLVLDKVNGIITYNGEQLNDSNINLLDSSTIELISIEPLVCDLSTDPCEQGILKLTLTLEVVLTNGHALEAQTYVTTILI